MHYPVVVMVMCDVAIRGKDYDGICLCSDAHFSRYSLSNFGPISLAWPNLSPKVMFSIKGRGQTRGDLVCCPELIGGKEGFEKKNGEGA